MATIYVAKTGNDGNAGTDPGSPKLTIQAAVDAADDSSPAVVIILDSNTYNEAPQLGRDGGFNFQSITIKGDDGQLPVMDGNGTGDVGAFRSGGIRGGGISINVIQNIKFIRYGGVRGVLRGDNGGDGGTYLVSDCEFNANTTNIIAKTFGDATNHTVVNRCKFTENTTNMVQPAGDMFCDFINCVFGIPADTEGINFGNGLTNGTVQNCSFVVNTDINGHFIIQAGTIENNVIQNLASSGDHLIGIKAHASRSNNATFGNFATAQTGGTNGGNNLEGQDPLFTDTTLSNPDLSIPSNSPLVDAGKTISAITVDFNGVTRPQNANYDIGAFEVKVWSDIPDDDPFRRKFGPNTFEIRSIKNKLRTRRFREALNNRQAPFSLTLPGQPSIRGTTKSYKTEE